MLPVVEKFVSINGEGAHAGELAAFIRFRGCNLDCSYCDTSWANCENASAEYETAEEIAEWVAEKGVENVTLTGGEPLLHKECGKVAELLMKQGCRVEIETNGSIHLEKLAAAEYRPVFTMDYKLPSSGMEEYMCRDNFRLLGEHDTVKFVSGSMEDLEKAAEIIRLSFYESNRTYGYRRIYLDMKESDMCISEKVRSSEAVSSCPEGS